jgi:ATP-dependent RNA helicase DDX6/DHH1
MGLKSALLSGIEKSGFEYPSPVQVSSIPHALNGSNIIVRAKNGTGKTAAYLIPLLNKIDEKDRSLQSIVLVPTRELALQVSKVCRRISKFMDIDVMPTYGGTNLYEDILRISRGVQIIVGTPGRIIDLTERNVAPFDECKTLVFDEADKLLSIEFRESIEKLIEYLPKKKQIKMYSATFPVAVNAFIEKYVMNPIQVNLMSELTLKGVSQFYAMVEPRDKLHCLKTLLTRLSLNQCIIFCNNVVSVEILARKMTEMGFPSYYIHSKMTQKERNTVFHNFNQGKCRILVSSDLVTRGIDVPAVNCVINFDLPKTTESYLHRIGRSGRFGNIGLAVNLVSLKDKPRMIEFEEGLGSVILPVSDEKFLDFMV